MANIDTLNSQLAAVGDAIRAKLETQDTYKISEMPDAIASISGGDLPQIIIEDVAHYLNYNGFYDFLYSNYINNITTRNLSNIEWIFAGDGSSNKSLVEDLSSLTLNFSNTSVSCKGMFQKNENLKKLPKIGSVPLQITNCDSAFQGAYHLEDFGDFGDSTKVSFAQGSYQRNGCLSALYTIRTIPNIWLKDMIETSTNTTFLFHPYYNNFVGNYNVDEYNGIGVSPLTFTSNMFNNSFTSNCCCKKLTFATNNGIPYTAQWKSQVLNIGDIGYVVGGSSTENNYIIPVRGVKRVYDAASYEALKNDPDWYSLFPAYSKYNHDSAVETINSLPDTSAYIATAGGTNTITFKGQIGSATDGGAINTLTAEEIAVATNKGWTVTLY